MKTSQLLAGFHAVTARARHAPDTIEAVYADAQRRDKRMQTLLQQLQDKSVKVHLVNSERLGEIAGTVKHQGILAMASQLTQAQDLQEVFDDIEGPALFLVLDGVTDPHNLGACLRTADAAGVHAVLAPKDRAVGLSAVVQRVACGAAQTTPYLMVTNLARTLRELKALGVWIVGTDEEAEQTLDTVDLTMPTAWVMGAEGEGMRRLTKELCDVLVRIPMNGSVESLNVSVATGVCLFESVRQRGQKKAMAS
jgi:23S rRNA (guanosine2251-2'-O)-methyltransferase